MQSLIQIIYFKHFLILDKLSKIEQELKEINVKVIKLQKRKAELLEQKEKLKQLSYQKQTNSISDQNKWTHKGITSIALKNTNYILQGIIL